MKTTANYIQQVPDKEVMEQIKKHLSEIPELTFVSDPQYPQILNITIEVKEEHLIPEVLLHTGVVIGKIETLYKML